MRIRKRLAGAAIRTVIVGREKEGVVDEGTKQVAKAPFRTLFIHRGGEEGVVDKGTANVVPSASPQTENTLFAAQESEETGSKPRITTYTSRHDSSVMPNITNYTPRQDSNTMNPPATARTMSVPEPELKKWRPVKEPPATIERKEPKAKKTAKPKVTVLSDTFNVWNPQSTEGIDTWDRHEQDYLAVHNRNRWRMTAERVTKLAIFAEARRRLRRAKQDPHLSVHDSVEQAAATRGRSAHRLVRHLVTTRDHWAYLDAVLAAGTSPVDAPLAHLDEAEAAWRAWPPLELPGVRGGPKTLLDWPSYRSELRAQQASSSRRIPVDPPADDPLDASADARIRRLASGRLTSWSVVDHPAREDMRRRVGSGGVPMDLEALFEGLIDKAMREERDGEGEDRAEESEGRHFAYA